MDKALRLLAKLRTKLVSDEELARAGWKAAVGERLESRLPFRALVRDRIVVEVEDRTWQRQMAGLETQILLKLERVLGKSIATQIEFRIAIPKPGPQRAVEGEFQLRHTDQEARGIQDAGLRRVYLRSKRQAAGQ